MPPDPFADLPAIERLATEARALLIEAGQVQSAAREACVTDEVRIECEPLAAAAVDEVARLLKCLQTPRPGR